LRALFGSKHAMELGMSSSSAFAAKLTQIRRRLASRFTTVNGHPS
jgi:hypothetical protein